MLSEVSQPCRETLFHTDAYLWVVVFVDTCLSGQRPLKIFKTWETLSGIVQKITERRALCNPLTPPAVITCHHYTGHSDTTRIYFEHLFVCRCAMLKLRFESISLVTSHNTLKTLPVVQRDRRRIDFGFRSTLDGRRVIGSGGTLWSVVPKSPNIKYRTPIQWLFCNLFAFNVNFTWHWN